MAYGNSYKERLDAIPGQTYAPPREVLPSTKAILAQGSDATLQAGREPYVSKFSPKGDKARGLVAAPQQYYGSEADIMQSEVIRNTNADPFATRTAVQNARLQDGRVVPARPQGFWSWRYRWAAAWLVWTGRADAFVWPGQ